jgi:hypothetical protein
MLCRRRPPLWSSGQSYWLHNGDVLCFLWGTNWIYICYVKGSRPPLWSSGQSSWLHNGDVLCFLWGTNWIYICYVKGSTPPLWSSGQSSWLHNGHVLCFLWGKNWIYICYVEERRPPLWSSGQSSWLQIQRCGFDSRSYHIFWEVVGLERGPLSLMSTTEELLGRKSSGFGLESRENRCGDLLHWPPHFYNTYRHNSLSYKPEDSGFETQWGERILSIHLILPTALGPGVPSTSNRNGYKKQTNKESVAGA